MGGYEYHENRELGFTLRENITKQNTSGILFNSFVDFDNNLLCILYGLFSIGFALISISTAVLNMSRQPLLNGIRLIISITEIVFSILLIIRTVNSLYAHMAFIGIASVVMAVTLLIEFMVHRYQRI